MNKINVQPAYDLGLGGTISLLSLLVSSQRPIVYHATHPNTIAEQLIKIYQTDNIELVVGGTPTDECTDLAKFFSPYIQPRFEVCTNKKPFIGISIQRDPDKTLTGDLFPNNRYYTDSEWTAIIKLARTAGYDVITLDNYQSTIEQKVKILNEYCDCVIAYEGGIAHVAHTLSIPSIILPWRRNTDGTLLVQGRQYKPHALHKDSRTWFLQSVAEILAWHPQDLHDMIARLKQCQGNNIFLGSDIHVDPDSLLITKQSRPDLNLNFGFSDWEKDFIRSNKILDISVNQHI
jgi:hypothetical protein